MTKELKKLMKKNDFEVIRNKKHIVWKHKENGALVTTSSTPSNKNAIKMIMKDIRKEVGVVYA